MVIPTPTTVQVKIQLRGDTAANWASVNPVLLTNELGLETDTKKIKVGNGSTAWNSLAYFPFVVSGGTVTGNLEIGTTGTLTFEGSSADNFETTLGVVNPTADRTINLPNVSGTIITTGDTGTVTSTMIADGTIVNADVSAAAAIAHSKLATITAGYVLIGNASNVPTATAVTGDVTINSTGITSISSGVIVDGDVSASAEIAVSKLANGTVNQVLVTDGTDVSWSDDLTLAGNLTVNGTTTTVNTETLTVKDKNIELAVVDTPTDVTADGGGITLKGATDKTITWSDTSDSWEFNQPTITTGNSSAAAFVPTGSTVPSNGVYLSSANNLAISTNGTGKLFIDNDGRVSVGIANNGTAKNIFQVNSEDVPGDGIGIYSDFTATGAELGAVNFYPSASSNGASARVVAIDNRSSGTGSRLGSLAFHTADASVTAEKMRLTNNGRLGIGTTSPVFPLHLEADYASTNTVERVAAFYRRTSGTAGAGIGAEISLGAELGTGTGAGGVNTACTIKGILPAAGNAGEMVLTTADSGGVQQERARIDSSGRLLVGTSTARTNVLASLAPAQQIEGTTADTSRISIARNTSSQLSEPAVIFIKSRGTANGSNAIVQNDDRIGAVQFTGSDGSKPVEACSIRGEVDGTPGADDMPGRLVFSTTADGASSPTERMRIDSSGDVLQSKSAGTLDYTVQSNSIANDQAAELIVRATATGTRTGALSIYKHSGITNPVCYVYMQAEDGSGNYIWVDNSDVLRISTTKSNVGTTGGTVVGTQTSDERIKNVLGPVEYGLETLKQVEPVRYSLKSQPDIEQLGFIAQQVQTLIPQSVFDTGERIEGEPEDAPTKLGMEYVALIPVLVNAIKELSAEVDALKTQLQAS